MHKHNDTIIKTSDTVLRKIYLSLYLKGLCVRGSWRPNRTATYWPPTLLAITAFISRSPGLLKREPWGPASLGHILILASSHQLVWSPNCSIGGLRAPFAGCRHSLVWSPNWLTSCLTELYNSSTTTFFLWASQITLIQPIHGQNYTLLFLDRMHQLFT